MATHADPDFDGDIDLALTLSLLSYDDFCDQQIALLSPQRLSSASHVSRSTESPSNEVDDLTLALRLSSLSSDRQVTHHRREESALPGGKIRPATAPNVDVLNRRNPSRAAARDNLTPPLASRAKTVPRGAFHAESSTSSVGAPATALTSAPLTVNSVVTNLSASRFEMYLERFGLADRYPLLVLNISNGFPIALPLPKLDRTFAPSNHYKSRSHGRIIQEKIDEEVAAGRMSGPFSPREASAFLGGHYRTSPLSLVPKSEDDPESADSWRMIQNMSFKDRDNVSVNDFINSDDFPTSSTTAQRFADWVAAAPPGAQAAQIDLEAAYRQMPILPEHKPYLAIRTERGLYADHCNPFGLSSSAGILGMAVEAAVDIVKASLHMDCLAKWVDDMIPTRVPVDVAVPECGSIYPASRAGGKGPSSTPRNYPYELEDVLAIFLDLGFKIKLDKLKDFASCCVYNGFAWDLQAKVVSLPEEKRGKYLKCILVALDPGTELFLKEAQTLQGFLAHVCFVYREGRAHMPSIHRYVKSFNDNISYRQAIPEETYLDLEWWSAILSMSDFGRPLHIRSLVDLDIWVDASTVWGIALVVGNQYQAWKLREGWDTENRHIGWAESVAIELAVVYITRAGYQDVQVLVHSDNTGAIGQFSRGRSRNRNINDSIIRAEALCRGCNISIFPDYVKSAVNRADAASRGTPQPDLTPLTPSVELPAEIEHLFIRPI